MNMLNVSELTEVDMISAKRDIDVIVLVRNDHKLWLTKNFSCFIQQG